MVALITRLLEEKGKSPPIVIGGCALSAAKPENDTLSELLGIK